MHDLVMDIPFVSRCNPGLAATVPRHLDWLNRHGLLADDGAEARYLDWRFPEMPARWWPDTTGHDFDFACNMYAWLLILDGQFDRDWGFDVERTRDAMRELVAVLHHAGPSGASPAVTSFTEIWDWQRSGMSRFYVDRARSNWENVFKAFEAETHGRIAGGVPSESDYLRLRHASGLMHPLLDMNERLRRREVGPVVWQSPVFRALHEATVWLGCLIDDVYSYEREELQGDYHNLVFVFERSRDLPRAEAVNAAVAVVEDHARAFLAAEARLPEALDRLGVPADQRTAVYECVEDMRLEIAACNVWCRTSSRYTPVVGGRDEQNGYLGDIFTTAGVGQ